MLSLGAALKRKSIQKVEPTLPRPKKLREPSTSGRTIYQQLKAPSEQLKQFRKKQLLTLGNLSTEKSQSNIRHEDYFTKRHSRFDDDHHNTESIAQLMESKLVSGGKTKVDSLGQTQGETMREDTGLDGQPKESIDSVSVIEKENEEDGDPKEENYDDYVLGDKVEEDTPSEKPEFQHKKYMSDNDSRAMPSYQAVTEAEKRAQQIHWIGQRRKLNQLKQDQQIVAIMQQYQTNRQKVLNQSRKKHQTARILAAAHRNYQKQQAKIQKSTSLPALRPKMEFIIEQAPIESSAQPWKSDKNLLSKGLSNKKTEKYIESRLRQSLSYAKLGFGRKKIRTICEQQIMQEQMNELEQIKGKLRSKGITFDADKLKKGLVNMKNEPLFQQTDQYPEKKLPSNFIYKKFPL